MNRRPTNKNVTYFLISVKYTKIIHLLWNGFNKYIIDKKILFTYSDSILFSFLYSTALPL